MSTTTLEDRPGLTAKYLDATEINLEPGEPAAVAWLTLDVPDREADVVIPSGIDFRSEYLDTNPVVMASHDYQRWPVGTCQWIKAKRNRGFSGLIAKTIFDVEDPDARRLFGLVQRKVVRSVSIGFRPPDDFKPADWGPPTNEELKARPDWATARRIIRRCVLIEYSFCSIGMNAQALVVAVSKGLELPSYLTHLVPQEGKSMPETPETDADVTASDTKAMNEGSGTDGGYAVKPDDDAKQEPSPANPDPDDDGDDDTSAETDTDHDYKRLKAGDYVEFGHGRAGGAGKIVSVHRGGFVPGVEEDVEGTEDEPAARIKVYMYRSDTGKHHPTTKHVGRMLKDLTKVHHPMAEGEDMPYEEPGEKISTVSEIKGVVPFAAGPVDESAWDAAAARSELAKWASSDGSGSKDTMDWARYEKGFAWVDGSRKEEFGGYRLPHHCVHDGKLYVSKRGVEAAYGALEGARGGVAIPEADHAGVKAHLAKHYAEWGAVPGKDGKSLVVPPHKTIDQIKAEIERKAAERFGAETLAQALVDATIDRTIGAV
jgi:hypothetical protein